MTKSRFSKGGTVGAKRGTVAVAVLSLSLVLAACSSGDAAGSAETGEASSTAASSAAASSGAASSEVAAPSGDPIKVMTITSVDFNGASFPQVFAGAKAYEMYINDKGGIKGRPLEVLTCDDKGSAAGAEACAREAVAQQVVSVVGSAGFYGSNIQAITSPAGITFFGTCCGFAPVEFNDPLAFTYGLDPVSSVASMLIAMQDDTCEAMAVLAVDLPVSDAINDGAEQILMANGYTGTVKFVKFSGVGTDYTPEVSKALADDTDCLGVFGNDQHWAAMLPVIFASGSTANLYGYKGNLSPSAARGFEDKQQIIDGTVLSPYADISNEAYADFRAAIEASGQDPSFDYNSLAGLGIWSGLEGFTQVVEGITGDITAASFADQVTKTVIDNGGQTPSIDFTTPLTGGVAPWNERVFNRTYFIQKFDGSPNGEIDMQPYIDKL